MGTRVEVTVQVNPVMVGGILPIQCKISDIADDHRVKILRVTDDQTEEIASGLDYFSSSFGQRVFITERRMSGGILMYFMTIIDISMLDKGEYYCQVYALSGADSVKVAEGLTNVEIYFLPDSIYPICDSTPAATQSLNVGAQLKLSCISAKGAPPVTLRWIDNSNQEISSRSKIQDDTVSSESSLWTAPSHQNKVFICEMTSPGFQDIKRSCKIGPITIKKATQNDNINVLPPVVTQPTKTKTVISNDCSSECPKDNKYTILYLSVSTVSAAILCVVFLTTTIIWCYKYHNISSEIGETQINITSCDGSEPVYVSLQKRQEPERRSLYMEPERSAIYREPDRSSTYMSVEDPNNPGSKVLMPKEVFEEFYNSLRLKKGLKKTQCYRNTINNINFGVRKIQNKLMQELS